MVDVTVRGAGIFGLSAAWVCARRGAKVRVVDLSGPGAGSSGGVVGALAPHVPENWNAKKAFQLDSLLMAEPFWQEVEATGGVLSGYARLGRLQPLADARAVEQAERRGKEARILWQGRADWRVIAAQEAGPWAPVSPTGLLIHDTLTARLHPRRACAALVAALAVQGVNVVTDAPDQGQVIWATGRQGLSDLGHDLGRPVGTGVKGQALLLRHAVPDMPQLFVDGLHLVPHADGTLAVGSTSEREFDAPDTVDDACEALLGRAVQAVPVLAGAAVVERWAGVRPRARTRAPMLGAWPRRTGHFVMNGGFKIGFGMAPKLAMLMADLVLDGAADIPADFTIDANL